MQTQLQTILRCIQKLNMQFFWTTGLFLFSNFKTQDEKELLEDLNLALLKIINIWMDVKHNLQQEYIPVGCVPTSAAVAASWGVFAQGVFEQNDRQI